jgi:hypothetical protein
MASGSTAAKADRRIRRALSLCICVSVCPVVATFAHSFIVAGVGRRRINPILRERRQQNSAASGSIVLSKDDLHRTLK